MTPAICKRVDPWSLRNQLKAGLAAVIILTALICSGCAGVTSQASSSSSKPATVSISAGALPSAQTQSQYSVALSASGGNPPYSWAMESGNLPIGLALSAAGIISGTPSQAGNYTFTAQVTDSSSPVQTASQSFNLTASVTLPLTVSTTSLSGGTTGTLYSASLASGGGTGPYAWSISSGSLPTGLSLYASNGTISGTPTAPGTSSFTVQVTDSTTPTAQTATKSLSITVTAAGTAVSITTMSLANGQQGTPYSANLSASGGTTPYTWSISLGSLPAGLNLNTSSGTLSGTPTAPGTSSFTVQVTDSTTPTAQTATKQLSVTVTAAGTVNITTASLANGQVGTPYSQTLTATGGTKPYTWSLASGTLPTGLALNSSTGVISGTPTATVNATPLTFKVTDSTTPSAQTNTASLSITIAGGTSHSVLLNWDASLSSATSGYNVYRSNISGSGYTKINSTSVSALTYTDTTVSSGQTYYYVTTAVDSSGDESVFSNELQEVIP